MNKEDLIKKYEGLEGVWDANGAEIARQCFLRDLEQLNEIDTKKSQSLSMLQIGSSTVKPMELL